MFVSNMMNTGFGRELYAGTMISMGVFDLTQNPDRSMNVAGPGGFEAPMNDFFNVQKWKAPTESLTRWQKLGYVGAGLGGTLLPAAIGYSEGGMRGAASAVAGDVASHAALVRYHYAPATVRGASGIVAPGLFTGFGGSSAMSMRAMNTVGYLGKGLVGGITGYMGGVVGNAIGGGLGSMFGYEETGKFIGQTSGVFAGTYAGTAAAGLAASSAMSLSIVGGVGLAAGAIVGGGALAGYGTYQTLKAGYHHKQRQKSIQTSGDLASFSTQGAHTMRERAVSAIHKSHLNARSALGQEASLMHFPSRNYHSNYRKFY